MIIFGLILIQIFGTNLTIIFFFVYSGMTASVQVKVESLTEVHGVGSLSKAVLKSCTCFQGFRKHLGKHFHCRICDTTSRYSHKIIQHEDSMHQNATLDYVFSAAEMAVDESQALIPVSVGTFDLAKVESLW
jgi:hypothetical protein